jgi:soluble lytic murein transglycosylase-like protein
MGLLLPSTGWAQIYAGTDVSGQGVVLSNFQSESVPDLLIQAPVDAVQAGSAAARKATSVAAVGAAASPRRLRLPAIPGDLRRVIDNVAAKVDIPAELLHAVIATESSYNSRARSPKGAMGLMQLMPATAQRFGAQDPYAPLDNVTAGATYLKWLMAKFQNDLELVLAAYNAGEQAVINAGGKIPPYAETQAYVPRVLGFLRCASDATCMPV